MDTPPSLLPGHRICVVEDDARLSALVCLGLQEMGHTTLAETDGQHGLALAMSFDFDLIILDVGLPGLDGCSMARAIRERKKTPILMLTARDSEDDILRGFDAGADDYLTKPFSFRELLARLEAIARAGRWQSSPLQFDGTRLKVSRNGIALSCTKSEFLLFSALHRSANAAVNRTTLMRAVWGPAQEVPENSLEVLVSGLRAKLESSALGESICTVRGVGYRLQAEVAPVVKAAHG